MNGIVFKQSYKTPGEKSAVLNKKHLIYIATRPGAMYNNGCGFGLWGRLPGERVPENINNLSDATKTLMEATQTHTTYRAIFSVDDEMANKFSLYSRENWEALLKRHINTLAKEMNIEQKDFCWMASMHYAKGHPHVHVVYWDNSGKPRNPYMTEERFEEMSNRVRADFNREFFSEEIKREQAEQKAEVAALREELEELLGVTDVSAALNLNRIPGVGLDELSDGLIELVRHVPDSGSLRYKYLPRGYKAQVDEWISRLLTMPQFSAIHNRYIAHTDKISSLYGNDSAMAEANRGKAMQKLYTNLGNEVLNMVRDAVKSLDGVIPINEDAGSMKTGIEPAAVMILRSSAAYEQWLEALPDRKTPMDELRKDGRLEKLERELIQELATDIRLQKAAKAWRAANRPDDKGKLDSSELFAAASRILHEQTAQDKGYDKQLAGQAVMRGLLRLFAQGKRQEQSQKGRMRAASRDMSKAARKDLQKRRQQAGSWEAEL